MKGKCGRLARIRSSLLALASLLVASSAAAQAPRLTGRVDIDLPRGLLSGDVCLSDLPARDTLRFLLNRGLVVAAVRDGKGRLLAHGGFYGGRVVGEGVSYAVPDRGRALRELCVRYGGAFPVYGKLRSVTDDKGVIAFDSATVRASEQTRWYPTLVDPESGAEATDVRYDLTIRCVECREIYLNGSSPGSGPELSARSSVPRPLLLYAGSFEVHERDGAVYLGAGVSDAAASVIGGTVDSVKDGYAAFLGLPYRDAPVFLDFWPVTPRGEHAGWAFTTWPTIAMAERTSFDDLVRDGRMTHDYGHLLAHEMGHYYFGTMYRPSGPYFWFLLESTAEYLSLRAMRSLEGRDAYRKELGFYVRHLPADSALAPLDRIRSREQIGGAYRYRYGPLLLVSLERAAGSEAVGRLLHDLLAGRGSPRTWPDFRRLAAKAGIDEATWRRWVETCVDPPARESCLARLGS